MERTCTGRFLVNVYYLRMVIRRCRANLSVAAFSEAFTFSAPERLPNKVRVPRQLGCLGLRPWRSML
jgi:hypothetical protein